MDDSELWQAWIGGDEAAGNRLVERCFLGVHRFFQSKVPEQADELTQRTFLACLEQRASYRAESSFRGYLFGIARKQLLRHFEGRGGGGPLDPLLSTVHDLEPSPSKVLAGREHHDLLLEGLQRIPLDFQIVIELHYWEDLKIAEIAEALQIAAGTVKSRLSRAKGMLRDALTELGGRIDDLDGDTRTLGRVLRGDPS